jgi:hypothetical protein
MDLKNIPSVSPDPITPASGSRRPRGREGREDVFLALRAVDNVARSRHRAPPHETLAQVVETRRVQVPKQVQLLQSAVPSLERYIRLCRGVHLPLVWPDVIAGF